MKLRPLFSTYLQMPGGAFATGAQVDFWRDIYATGPIWPCDGELHDVRFGSEADMCSANAYVRYGPIADKRTANFPSKQMRDEIPALESEVTCSLYRIPCFVVQGIYLEVAEIIGEANHPRREGRPKLKDSLFISLLAGNPRVETG